MHASKPIPNYVSDLSVNFDEQRGLYIGEFYSGGTLHRIEGADRAQVDYLMEAVVREQYEQMVHELNYWKQREAARQAAQERAERGRGGSSTKAEKDDSPRRIDGIPVRTYKADERTAHKLNMGSVVKWGDMMMMAASLAHGNYGDLAYHAIATALGDWYEGVESIWNKKPKIKIFAVSFGGIIITATSRKMLRKLLMRQQNIRIQRIMMNVREHKKNQDDAQEGDARSKAADRLRAKKKKAEILRPKSWERKLSPQGQETGWRGKTLNLKERLKDKKNRAHDLWEHKLS
ncbi:MAG: hypothetical protein K0R98_139 [Rickettsiaceae bacterium]|nr:hypothetical protein [Rickettsiaceae bacterium]